MTHLLEILGRGLLAELAAAFRDLLRDTAPESTADLQTVVDQNPGSLEHRRKLAVRLLREGNYSAASAGFLATLESIPTDHLSRIGAACALDEMGATRAALDHLRIALNHDPSDAPTWFALGFCQEKLGEPAEAVASYVASLRFAPQLRNAHERLAAIYLRLDNVQQAIAHYEHLCWCDPGDVGCALTLAALYMRAERFPEALRQYQNAITIEPDNWEAQDELVNACVAAGRYDDAIHALRELIAHRPECAGQHVQLGDLYAKTGRFGEALQTYRRAVQLNPDHLEGTIKLGAAQLRRGAYVEAVEAFERAIQLNDRVVGAYLGLSVAQHALGKTSDASASLDMAAGIEPNSTALVSELARLQLAAFAAEQEEKYLSPAAIAAPPCGPHDGAISTAVRHQIARLREALKRHPNHADWHYHLGVLLRGQGELPAAVEAFRKAVAINGNYLAALCKLALSLRDTGQLDEAINVLQQAIAVDPESIELHYQLGLLFADQNQFTLALERFDHAVRHDPHNADYLANLALALQTMGLVERADAAWHALCDVAVHADRAEPPRVSLGTDSDTA